MSLSDHQPSYRILDASLNRAAEGLRTLEEYARFAIDDHRLTSELKSLRHSLVAATSRLPRHSLLAARDTAGDLGTAIGLATEYSRASVAEVVAAAASRTQQSLRCLEEYGKTIDAAMSAELEQLRYRSYQVCAELELRAESPSQPDRRRLRLASAHLYVLTDGGGSPEALTARLRSLAAGGVDVVQLRDHALDDRTLFERAKLGAVLARELSMLWIVNDRADLAVAADTDGVHVGQKELPAPAARQLVGTSRLVGVSTHAIDEARQAVADGADYIGCGPVFPGQTKKFERYVGTQLLCEIEAEIEIPAFAIGGIAAANLNEVLQTGCRRIAVTAAISDAADPESAALQLRQRLGDAAKSRAAE